MSEPEIDLHQAMRIAQEYVGAGRVPSNRDEVSELAIYGLDCFPPNLHFYFAVCDRSPWRVCGDEYLAISKVTGTVHSFGVVGD